jgi:tRNA nucleotidyltransferase (CCA-adding enzyme)
MAKRLQIVLPESVSALLDVVRRAGGRPLLVGGSVRDAAMGSEVKDFDVEVYGLGVDPLVEALRAAGKVNAVGRSFGVLKVHVGEHDVDVSLPRRESKRGRGHRGFLIEPDPGMSAREAASRRDFTINALAWDPESGELLDFFGGLDDLQRRLLRHVGPAFADDPLRVLRGVQFAGRFALTPDADTVQLSRRLFREYDTLATERIWAEWYKWAARSRRPSLGLAYLRQSGWIEAYPELVAMHDCPQEPEWHPEGDVWTHTLLVADSAAEIATRDGLAGDDRAVLLLAALCHDLGKPETTVEEGGRIRSPGHAAREETYRRFLARIDCPARLASRVVVLCRHHLDHIGFAGSRRQVRRLARNLGAGHETLEMLARLIEADGSGRPPLPPGLPEKMKELLEVAREVAALDAAPKPLLLGRHLLELGLEPGPAMGRLLRQAYEAQLDGAFDDLGGARRWAGERLDHER